ncbi:MAG TPA: hypothetical protein VG605_22510 [Puia sp.]|nr:hypothetical protein [Puia sp.]
MLQNRVDPLGNIIRTSARGAWMGNRGLLHDEHQHVLRSWRLKAWLICVLDFKGRRRKVMSPNRYTELFFLDEATAFAAGHRPCFECRREAANRFKALWVEGNPDFHFTEATSIDGIDAVLHQERMDRKGNKVTFSADVSGLPKGVFVMYEGRPHLVADGALHPWTPFGYEAALALPAGQMEVLTPRSTVNAFRMGYAPQIRIKDR